MNRLLKIILLLLSCSIIYGQIPNLSGDWKLARGGSKMKIYHSNNVISVVLDGKSYDCTIEGNTITGTREIPNQWFGDGRECYEKIMTDPELSKQFKEFIILQYANYRFSGEKRTPTFVCNEGNPEILDGKTTRLKVLRKPNDMFWITENSIIKCNVDDPSSQQTVISGIVDGSSLALADGGNKIFWSENSYVYSANSDGTNQRMITKADEPVFSPRGLALDSEEKIVFWIEDRSIFRFDYVTGNNNRHKIITQGVYAPVQLALDKKEKRIYWRSDYTDVIKRSYYDGKGIEDFIELDAVSMALDDDERILYVGQPLVISKVNIDTKDTEVVIEDVSLPFGMYWDKEFGRLYWQENHVIFKANKANYVKVSTNMRSSNAIRDIALSSQVDQARALDPDENFNIWTLLKNRER